MRIIFPHVTYREALGLVYLETPFDRKQAQTVKMFQDISCVRGTRTQPLISVGCSVR